MRDDVGREPGLSVHCFQPQLLPAVAKQRELAVDGSSFIVGERRLLHQATSIMKNATNVRLLVCQPHHELLHSPTAICLRCVNEAVKQILIINSY